MGKLFSMCHARVQGGEALGVAALRVAKNEVADLLDLAIGRGRSAGGQRGRDWGDGRGGFNAGRGNCWLGGLDRRRGGGRRGGSGGREHQGLRWCSVRRRGIGRHQRFGG
jgi:hypothetical protein